MIGGSGRSQAITDRCLALACIKGDWASEANEVEPKVQRGDHQVRKIDELLLADSREIFVAKLEAFADHFEHLATTTEQRDLAAEFNRFVAEYIRGAYPHIEEMNHRPSSTDEEKPFWKEHGHESLSGLFEEIRADEAAATREDAHWYGREAFKKILDGKTEIPAAEMAKDIEIER
jgi:hypothetical protein